MTHTMRLDPFAFGLLAAAAPPSEVPGDAAFGSDRATLSWSQSRGGPSLYRVRNGLTTVSVKSIGVSAIVVTLSLGGHVDPGALVSYGYSKAPGSPWVKDAAGTAVAVFQDVAAQ